MDKTTEIIFIVFTAVVSISVLIQLSAIAAMFFAARKTQKKVHALVEDLRMHVIPAVSASRNLIEDLSPKIKIIASNLTESSNSVRAMAEEVGGVVEDVAERTRARAASVDGMVQGTLDHINHATGTIQHGVAAPLRQLNGILNGVRAGINVMCQKAPSAHDQRGEPENDLFI